MINVEAVATKICRICEIEKSLTDYYHEKSNADGYRSECKICYGNRIKRWHRETNYRSLREQQARHPEKDAARRAARAAIRAGRLIP